MFTASRREFLKTAASAAVVSSGASFTGIAGASAAEAITATEWGGHFFEAIKKTAAKQSFVHIDWQLFTGQSDAWMKRWEQEVAPLL